MGQEAQGRFLRSHLRAGRGVCQVSTSQSGFSSRRTGRFRQLCYDETSTGNGRPADHPVSKWQRVPENKKLFSGHPKYDLGVTNHAEAGWLKDVCKLVSKGRNECKQLGLLEVYAYPNSKLTEVAQKCGLNARRFTKEHGDLSTHAGQVEFLTQVILFRPKHVWLAPGCGPWSSWNRFNSSRSVQSFVQVKNQQQPLEFICSSVT